MPFETRFIKHEMSVDHPWDLKKAKRIITVLDTLKTPKLKSSFLQGGLPIEFGGVISLQECQYVSAQYIYPFAQKISSFQNFP